MNPVTGIDNAAASQFLVERGIQAMQERAAFLPPITEDALLETETGFSIRTRSQRKTKHIRTMQWIQHITVISYAELMQIEFVTFGKYLLGDTVSKERYHEST